jgi:hypothetical protein
MCDEDKSCPFVASDCGLQRVIGDPCCKELCALADVTSWREPNGFAGFLTNFTRSLWGWDDNPIRISQHADFTGKLANERLASSMKHLSTL